MRKARISVLVGMVLFAAVARLLPHPPNFTPIAAMALFGGVYFADRRAAFLVPFAAMYLSDLFLGFFLYDFGWFHGTMPFVYGSFALTVMIGLWLRQHRTAWRMAGAVLASAILFFVVTNFGVWALGSLYPTTLDGLVAAYVAAIPFFHNTLLGTAVYTTVLFAGLALAEQRFPILRGPEFDPAKC